MNGIQEVARSIRVSSTNKIKYLGHDAAAIDGILSPGRPALSNESSTQFEFIQLCQRVCEFGLPAGTGQLATGCSTACLANSAQR